MSISISINRLAITLNGISSQVVEEAAQGLEQELTRRLGAGNIGQGLTTTSSRVDLGELHLSNVHGTSTLNAAGLRELIALQLIQAIEMQTGKVVEEIS